MTGSGDPLRVAHALGRFCGTRAWVVGDVMLDVSIRGLVDRMSPEAPVPVIAIKERTVALGGAGNVAQGLTALGASVVLGGVIGRDDAGEEVGRLCDLAGIATSALARVPSRETTSKTRVFARERPIARLDGECTSPIDADVIDTIVAALGTAEPPDVIVVSDYAKGVVAPRLFAWLASFAAARGLPLVVDPKGRDFARYAGATVITPNARELEAAGAPIEPTDDVALDLAARGLAECARAESLVLTLGAAGSALWREGRPLTRMAATARRVVDVTGAGDTLVATLALGLAAGLPLDEAAELANRAAGLAVERPGCAVIEARELARALSPLPSSDAALPRDGLATRVAWWRLRGDRVVFTNGCFDLLHTGHIALLERASSLGDALVVGLNSDTSVRQLKGPSRPIVPAPERARILAALRWVDAVVVFDDVTPLELIRELRPDVLVKGADYRIEEVVGRADVESWGGRVELVPLVDARSTTRLLALAGAAGRGSSAT